MNNHQKRDRCEQKVLSVFDLFVGTLYDLNFFLSFCNLLSGGKLVEILEQTSLRKFVATLLGLMKVASLISGSHGARVHHAE